MRSISFRGFYFAVILAVVAPVAAQPASQAALLSASRSRPLEVSQIFERWTLSGFGLSRVGCEIVLTYEKAQKGFPSQSVRAVTNLASAFSIGGGGVGEGQYFQIVRGPKPDQSVVEDPPGRGFVAIEAGWRIAEGRGTAPVYRGRQIMAVESPAVAADIANDLKAEMKNCARERSGLRGMDAVSANFWFFFEADSFDRPLAEMSVDGCYLVVEYADMKSNFVSRERLLVTSPSTTSKGRAPDASSIDFVDIGNMNVTQRLDDGRWQKFSDSGHLRVRTFSSTDLAYRRALEVFFGLSEVARGCK